MHNIIRWFSFLGLVSTFAWLLCGCQYQLGSGDLAYHYETLSIPYIEGDEDGDLTAQIIKTLSVSGPLRYHPEGGQLILKAKIIDKRDDSIGYRYDRTREGRIKHYIVPTETRLQESIELEVVEAATGKTIRGPTRIWGSLDFDHDYYSMKNRVNVFSLGQLNDVDAARDMAVHPLNRVIAEKVVDYLNNSW
jgi:hypothetical protein